MRREAPGVYRSQDDQVLILKVEDAWGWNLIVNDEWWNTFATKREALEALDQGE